MTSTVERNRAVAKALYENLKAGNLAAVLASFDEDIEIHEPDCLPYGGVYRGIDGVKKLFAQAAQHLDSRVFDVQSILSEGDRVVAIIQTVTRGARTPVLLAEESILRDGKLWRVRVYLFDPTVVINASAARKST